MASTALNEEEVQRCKRMLNAGEDVVIEALLGHREIDETVKLAAGSINTAAKIISTENARQAVGVQMFLRFAGPEEIRKYVAQHEPVIQKALASKAAEAAKGEDKR